MSAEGRSTVVEQKSFNNSQNRLLFDFKTLSYDICLIKRSWSIIFIKRVFIFLVR